jgi:hypothetical protein
MPALLCWPLPGLLYRFCPVVLIVPFPNILPRCASLFLMALYALLLLLLLQEGMVPAGVFTQDALLWAFGILLSRLVRLPSKVQHAPLSCPMASDTTAHATAVVVVGSIFPSLECRCAAQRCPVDPVADVRSMLQAACLRRCCGSPCRGPSLTILSADPPEMSPLAAAAT